MKQLTLLALFILAANIISRTPAHSSQANDLRVGKVALPIDSSPQTWCAASATAHSSINYSKRAAA
jgi:hypothetical protein